MDPNIEFHHLGVACKRIADTSKAYVALGYVPGETVFDPLQNINICFLRHPEMPCVELLEPADEKSPVVQILQKNGTTPYHTCYSVEGLDDAIKWFKGRGYIVVSKPKDACAIENRRVAFMYNADMGLIELVEK